MKPPQQRFIVRMHKCTLYIPGHVKMPLLLIHIVIGRLLNPSNCHIWQMFKGLDIRMHPQHLETIHDDVKKTLPDLSSNKSTRLTPYCLNWLYHSQTLRKHTFRKQPYNIIICDQCHMKIFTPNTQRRWKDAALARKQNDAAALMIYDDLTWPSWLWLYIITIILCITTTITVIIITILPPKVAAPLLTQSDVVSQAASLDPSFSSSGSFLWSLEGSFLIIVMIIVLIGSIILFIIVFFPGDFWKGQFSNQWPWRKGLEGEMTIDNPLIICWYCEHLSWWRLWWWWSSSSSPLSSSSLLSGQTHGWHQRRWTSKLTSPGKSSFVFNLIV